MLIVPGRIGALWVAAFGEVGGQIAVHVANGRPDDAVVTGLGLVEDRAHQAIGCVVKAHLILHGVAAFDDLVIVVEHVLETHLTSIDGLFDRGFDLTAGFLSLQDERRVIDLGARIGERIEHRV